MKAADLQPAATRLRVALAKPWPVVLPLVLVNLLAAVGQVLWAQDHLVAGLPGQVAAWLPFLFAGAVESIALFLAYQAHQARLADQASGYLAVSAYGWAGVAAWLQWSHWSPISVTAAVVYAAMSALSPWLWGIWSRSIHRSRLADAGLIEPRSIRFGRARWLLYPRRTFRVFREAVWAAVIDPTEAIRRFDQLTPTPGGPTPKQPATAPQPSPAQDAGSGVVSPSPPRPTPEPVAKPKRTPTKRAATPTPPTTDGGPRVTPTGWSEGLSIDAQVEWLGAQIARGCTGADCGRTARWSSTTLERRMAAASQLESEAQEAGV